MNQLVDNKKIRMADLIECWIESPPMGIIGHYGVVVPPAAQALALGQEDIGSGYLSIVTKELKPLHDTKGLLREGDIILSPSNPRMVAIVRKEDLDQPLTLRSSLTALRVKYELINPFELLCLLMSNPNLIPIQSGFKLKINHTYFGNNLISPGSITPEDLNKFNQSLLLVKELKEKHANAGKLLDKLAPSIAYKFTKGNELVAV